MVLLTLYGVGEALDRNSKLSRLICSGTRFYLAPPAMSLQVQGAYWPSASTTVGILQKSARHGHCHRRLNAKTELAVLNQIQLNGTFESIWGAAPTFPFEPF